MNNEQIYYQYFSIFLINLYKNQKIIFALFVLILMGLLSISISFITNKLLNIFGLNFTKFKHIE